MRKFMYTGAITVAVLAASIGVWRVYAGEDFSDDINVSLREILMEDAPTIYTPGGEVQEGMPVYVRTGLSREIQFSAYSIDPDTVIMDVTTGGVLSFNNGIPEVANPIESVPGFLLDATPISGTFHLSVIDVGLLEYEEEDLRGGLTGLVAHDFLRAVGTADSYYQEGVTETDAAEELIHVTVLDAALVDGDENGIPDATALLEPFTVMMGPDNNLTYVVDLGELGRGNGRGEAVLGLLTDDGPLRVTVDAPTMNQLAAAEAAYNLYAGRLIVNVATDPRDLVDLPDNADPAAEFDLANEEPRGFFIHTAIALTDAVDARGSIPQWTFLNQLPGDLTIDIEITGPGLINQLTDGDIGFGYVYGTETVQSGEDILIETGVGWGNASTFIVADAHNGDSFGGRGDDTEVEEGDDALIFETQSASGIIASNLMPELRSGGGGGSSGCFIATAAYGTPMASEIQSLRDMRDGYLIDTMLGAAFIDTYYRVSPPIAQMVSEYPAAKTVVRVLLAPVVLVSGWTVASPGIVTAIALVMLIAAMTGMQCFVRVPRHKQ